MRILFLESEHGRYSELKYASCVARMYADKLRRKGHRVYEIRRPTPDEANAKIRELNPDVIWFVGHGDPDRATLENIQLWVRSTNDLWQFRGKIVVAHSCLTGIELGKAAVAKGAVAYFGYTDEMWFVWCDESKYPNCACSKENPYGVRPEVWMKLVTYPHYPPLEFLTAVAEGRDFKEAFDYSLAVTDKLVAELQSIQPSSQQEASMIKVTEWALEGNRDDQVLYKRTVEVGGIETEQAGSLSKALAMALILSLPAVGLMIVGGGGNAGKNVPNI